MVSGQPDEEPLRSGTLRASYFEAVNETNHSHEENAR
jgi:hypothetical protein